MSDAETVADRIESVRQGTIHILESLVEEAKAFELPESPPILEEYHRKLEENTYRVLVVGEAKRGKSTFVNALIGRDILPTDVDVATCQVFHIRQAEYEAYHLRFEDGSEKEIAAEELGRYGSQAVTDVQGTPRLDQLIRWIEVDLPTRFLPKGVSLLDTPGVGSLYAAHAQITQRFVPLADTVIFVLDSGQPIIQAELEFIETILGITSNIFFIQTKVDQYRREQWQAIQRRNQEILKERFKDRLPEVRVWPISSTNLLKAVQTGDDDYLFASRYKQLSTVLQTFLFRVAGWDRSATAIKAAESYYTTARKTLVGRVDSLTEESEQKRSALQQAITQRKWQFDVEWGQHGQKRQELIQRINKVIDAGRQTFLQELQPDSKIEATARGKIDGLKSVEEGKQYSKAMDGEVIGAFLERWREVCQQTQRQCNTLLGEFLAIADAVGFSEETALSTMAARATQGLKVKTDWEGVIHKADTESGWVWLLGSLFFGEEIAALAALCWAGIRGWFLRGESRLTDAKKQLHEQLDQRLQAVQQHFLGLVLQW